MGTPQIIRKTIHKNMKINPHKILVIDDEIGIPGHPEQTAFLRAVGYYPSTGGKEPVNNYPYQFAYHTGRTNDNTNSVDAVKAAVLKGWPDADGNRWALILLDVRFGNDENFGFTLLRALREDSQFGEDLPVVVLTSEDEGKRATAGDLNANGFLPKNVALMNRKELEQRVLRFGLIPDDRPSALLTATNTTRLSGRSLPLLKVLREARATAIDLSNRIIYGETGTGKTELAGYIHCFTGRTGRYTHWVGDPLNEELSKAQLFGCWHGAHSLATEPYAGKIEEAHGGTFFLDEVANLSIAIQMALLQIRKQDDQGLRTLSRLGNYPGVNARGAASRERANQSIVAVHLPDHRIQVDVFLITGTKENLEDVSVREKLGFKEDFLNALGTPLCFPSLNNRHEDIPELFQTFVARELNKPGRQPRAFEIDTRVFDFLKERDWSARGNIRDLERIAQDAANSLGDFNKINIHSLPPDVREGTKLKPPLGGNIKAPPVVSPVLEVTKSAIQPLDEEYFGVSAFTLADLNHLLQRAIMLENAAEGTRAEDAAGNKTNLVPTRAVSRLMGRSISATNAKSIIIDILGPILRTPRYWINAYGEKELIATRSQIESRPVLMELDEWAKNRTNSPAK